MVLFVDDRQCPAAIFGLPDLNELPAA